MATPALSSIPRRLIAGPRNRFRLESLLLLTLASGFVALANQGAWFEALDQLTYDTIIKWHQVALDERIVVVAIDDASLHEYGPWPWPRDLQARLLERINTTGPVLIALDIIHANSTPHDEALVRAAAGIENLALPVIIDTVGQGQQPIEVMAFPKLLEAADILGHVQIDRDADGQVRGVNLYQGLGTPHWAHLMVAVAESLGMTKLPACEPKPQSMLTISKCLYQRIAFIGPRDSVPQVAAHHLLKDNSVNADLQGRIVLVGLTALGAGDAIATPIGGDTGPLSGVEFNANLLNALLNDVMITTAPALSNTVHQFVSHRRNEPIVTTAFRQTVPGNDCCND